MSQLSVSLLRLGFLVLLWALVLVAIAVLRSDLYGTRVTSRGKGRDRRDRTDGRANKRAAPSRASTGVQTRRSLDTDAGRRPPRHHIGHAQGHHRAARVPRPS